MDAARLLESECERLGQALKSGRVPRPRRAEVRALLRRAFAAANVESETRDAAALASLIDEVERAIRECPPPPLAESMPRLARLLAFTTVRIRAARAAPSVVKTAERYARVGARLDARVAWLWKRCEQNQVEQKRPVTAREKAAAEFAEDDLEFVWGKKPR